MIQYDERKLHAVKVNNNKFSNVWSNKKRIKWKQRKHFFCLLALTVIQVLCTRDHEQFSWMKSFIYAFAKSIDSKCFYICLLRVLDSYACTLPFDFIHQKSLIHFRSCGGVIGHIRLHFAIMNLKFFLFLFKIINQSEYPPDNRSHLLNTFSNLMSFENQTPLHRFWFFLKENQTPTHLSPFNFHDQCQNQFQIAFIIHKIAMDA